MTKESFERARHPVRASSAVLIENNEGKLLLIQQASQEKGFKWGPPAGRIKAFEDPMITAKRETKEEIGFDVELVDIVGIYPVSRGEKATSFAFVFRGKIIGGRLSPNKEEIKDFDYYDFEGITELEKSGKLYRPEYNVPAIKDWKDGRSYPLDVIKSINPEKIFENPPDKDSGDQSGVFQ